MLSLKMKRKSSQNRCKPPKNCLTLKRDSRKTLKKEKGKQKKKKCQITTINIFYLYFVKKNIWKNLVYIVTLLVFSRGRLLEME